MEIDIIEKWLGTKSKEHVFLLKELNETYPDLIQMKWDENNPQSWEFFQDHRKNRDFFVKNKKVIHKYWLSQFDCDFVPQDFPYFDEPVDSETKWKFLAFIYGGNIPRKTLHLEWILARLILIVYEDEIG